MDLVEKYLGEVMTPEQAKRAREEHRKKMIKQRSQKRAQKRPQKAVAGYHSKR